MYIYIDIDIDTDIYNIYNQYRYRYRYISLLQSLPSPLWMAGRKEGKERAYI